jgi:hypothetical protein
MAELRLRVNGRQEVLEVEPQVSVSMSSEGAPRAKEIRSATGLHPPR